MFVFSKECCGIHISTSRFKILIRLIYVSGWGTSATPSTQSWWCSSGASSLPALRWPETSGTLWWASASSSSPTSELPPPWDNEAGRGSKVRGGEMFAVVPRRLCSGLQSRIKRNIDGATWPSPQLSKCYISPLYLAFHSKTQGMDLFCSTTLRLTCGGPHLHSAHFWWVRPPLESTATRLSACYKELCIGWCESPQLVM